MTLFNSISYLMRRVRTDSSSLANLVILRDFVFVALTLATWVGIRIGHWVLRTLYLYIILFFLLNTLVLVRNTPTYHSEHFHQVSWRYKINLWSYSPGKVRFFPNSCIISLWQGSILFSIHWNMLTVPIAFFIFFVLTSIVLL